MFIKNLARVLKTNGKLFIIPFDYTGGNPEFKHLDRKDNPIHFLKIFNKYFDIKFFEEKYNLFGKTIIETSKLAVLTKKTHKK